MTLAEPTLDSASIFPAFQAILYLDSALIIAIHRPLRPICWSPALKECYRSSPITALQNVLQFQSLGTLAGTLSGITFPISAANAPLPLQLITGVAGMPSLPSSLPLPLPLPPLP